MPLVDNPTYTEFIDPRLVIEPLGGPQHPHMYTDRFSDEIYHKAPESHLIRFLTALLGPSGVGYIRSLAFRERLKLESTGLELFDLESFYGNPLQFGRITEELYESDPKGLLSDDEWKQIRIKDASYKNRAVLFMNGAKAGNTPLGMRLVAKSGLNHEVEIIENYKHLYDIHSDSPVGVEYQGSTGSLQEMIVMPRQESSRSEIQTIEITGNPTGGTFILFFNGDVTIPLSYNADMFDVQQALQDLSTIGPYGVQVRGGPSPLNPFEITFTGHLSNRDVPEITASNALTGGSNPEIFITTDVGGVESQTEIVSIPSKDFHHLQTALDKVKPVGVIPTNYDIDGTRKRKQWKSATSSSTHYGVIKYVTGNPAIYWPSTDNIRWIEKGVEKEAPRANNTPYHYQGFHNVKSISSYTNEALNDENYGVSELTGYSANKTGRFIPPQTNLPLFSFLSDIEDDLLEFKADRALADYFEPLIVSGFPLEKVLNDPSANVSPTQLINDIYPIEYTSLSYTPEIKYEDEQFWASNERLTGTDYLEIDFGKPVPVNYIYFEITKKPVDIDVSVDILDQSPQKEFTPISTTSDTSILYTPQALNPWYPVEINFQNNQERIFFTRYVRIGLTRRNSLVQNEDGSDASWSIEIRNLRLARNISTF